MNAIERAGGRSLLVSALCILWCCADGKTGDARSAEAGGITIGTPTSPSPPFLLATDPCGSRNPVTLLAAQKTRETGKPTTEVFPFTAPFALEACVRVTSGGKPRGGGDATSSAIVTLDSQTLLSQSDFSPSFPGATFREQLGSGSHDISIYIASAPGTFVEVVITAVGPFIQSFSPVVGNPGDTITIVGEGFDVTPSVTIAGTSFPVVSVSAAQDTIIATVPKAAPIGPLTVQTALGSATSTAVFTPLAPRGIVKFYQLASFQVADSGSCVAIQQFQLIEDGSRISFVIDFYRPLPSDAVIAINGPNAPPGFPLTVQLSDGAAISSGPSDTLGALAGATAVLSSTFVELNLNSPLTMGRMFLGVSATASCGASQFPSQNGTSPSFQDLRASFAPGLLIVQTNDPVGVSQRISLQNLVTAEDTNVSVMAVPSGMRLDDAWDALLHDSGVIAAVPDAVLYPDQPTAPAPCGAVTPALPSFNYETCVGMACLRPDVGQWTLGAIGLVPTGFSPGTMLNPGAGAGVTVATIDTGVDPDIEFGVRRLAGRDLLLPGFGFTGTPTDDCGAVSCAPLVAACGPGGHGTGVASIIAAAIGNGGMVGVAPAVSVFPIRVLNSCAVSDGFSVYRAFNLLATMKTSGALSTLQVTNVSMAEFTDYIVGGVGALQGIVTGVVSFLSGPAGIFVFDPSIPLTTLQASNGLASAMHGSAQTLRNAGVAIVASSGNSGGTILALAGTAFPANDANVFAVSSADDTGSLDPSSTPAVGSQTIALAAPVTISTPPPIGDTFGAPILVGAPVTGGYTCGAGTSYAAPLMSGAIANLLSPGSGGTPLPDPFTAAQQLIRTATIMTCTACNKLTVGGGELNLAAALTTPLPANWEIDAEEHAGFAVDFALLPHSGNFLLRNQQPASESPPTTIESISPATGMSTRLNVASTDYAWISGDDSQSIIWAGGTSPGRIDFLNTDGSVSSAFQSIPSASMKAAVSPFAVPGATSLVAFTTDPKTMRIRAGQAPNGPDIAAIQRTDKQSFLAAQWTASTGPCGPPGGQYTCFILGALTDLPSIEFYLVTENVSNCQNNFLDCPILLGSASLGSGFTPFQFAVTSDGSNFVGYVADGSTGVFTVVPGGTPVRIASGAFVAVAANPFNQEVYALINTTSSTVSVFLNEKLRTSSLIGPFNPFIPFLPFVVSPSGSIAFAGDQSEAETCVTSAQGVRDPSCTTDVIKMTGLSTVF
jgi:hypothetical protein